MRRAGGALGGWGFAMQMIGSLHVVGALWVVRTSCGGTLGGEGGEGNWIHCWSTQ